jgi:hypothetical protein
VTLTVADLDLFLRRHDDLEHAVTQIERFDAAFNRLLDFVFVPRIGVQDVPLTFRGRRDISYFGGPPGRQPILERNALHGHLLPNSAA